MHENPPPSSELNWDHALVLTGSDINLYIFFPCLYVSLFVGLYPINVQKAEPTGPTFCVGPRMTPIRFMNAQNYKKKFSKIFWFRLQFWKSMKQKCKSPKIFILVLSKIWEWNLAFGVKLFWVLSFFITWMFLNR